MKKSAHQDATTVARTQAALGAMNEVAPSLVEAIVLTDDGFEVARHPARGTGGATAGAGAADGSFAGMASSMQALSEAVAQELGIGTSQHVMIAAPGGHVVQLRIPDRQLVLAALFDTDETLGKALAASRRCAERIGADLAGL